MTQESSTEANREIVRKAFEAWQEGSRPILDLFAPDMRWRIEGRSLAARQYESKQAFIDAVLAPFGARFAQGERFRPVRIHGVYADGDSVVVHWDGHGLANDGEPYDNTYAWFMRLQDGQVVEAAAFYDALAFDELWRRVPAG